MGWGQVQRNVGFGNQNQNGIGNGNGDGNGKGNGKKIIWQKPPPLKMAV